MDPENRKAALAALVILVGFGFTAYWLPTIMLAVGGVSTALAAVVAVAFVLAFFIVLWLRSRTQRRKDGR